MSKVLAGLCLSVALALAFVAPAAAKGVDDHYTCEIDGSAEIDSVPPWIDNPWPMHGGLVHYHYHWICAQVDIDGTHGINDHVNDTNVRTYTNNYVDAEGTYVFFPGCVGNLLTADMSLDAAGTESPLTFHWQAALTGRDDVMVITNARDADSPLGAGAGVIHWDWHDETQGRCLKNPGDRISFTGAFTVAVAST